MEAQRAHRGEPRFFTNNAAENRGVNGDGRFICSLYKRFICPALRLAEASMFGFGAPSAARFAVEVTAAYAAGSRCPPAHAAMPE